MRAKNTRTAALPRQHLAGALGLVLAPLLAVANPLAPVVVSGQANFQTNTNTLVVKTATPATIINWQSFSINGGELTRFDQPSAASAVLNRVVGQDPSQILGALQSNGRVLLINPAGILIGKDALINVGGLMLSAMPLADGDFLANRFNFTGPGGPVTQDGSISAPGGAVLLIGGSVTNSGLIQTPGGQVVLAAGQSVTLAEIGTPNITVTLQAGTEQALNLGQILSEGGSSRIYGALIQQAGLIRTNTGGVANDGSLILNATNQLILQPGSQLDTRKVALQAPNIVVRGSVFGGEGVSVQAAGNLVIDGGVFSGPYLQINSPNIKYAGPGPYWGPNSQLQQGTVANQVIMATLPPPPLGLAPLGPMPLGFQPMPGTVQMPPPGGTAPAPIGPAPGQPGPAPQPAPGSPPPAGMAPLPGAPLAPGGNMPAPGPAATGTSGPGLMPGDMMLTGPRPAPPPLGATGMAGPLPESGNPSMTGGAPLAPPPGGNLNQPMVATAPSTPINPPNPSNPLDPLNPPPLAQLGGGQNSGGLINQPGQLTPVNPPLNGANPVVPVNQPIQQNPLNPPLGAANPAGPVNQPGPANQQNQPQANQPTPQNQPGQPGQQGKLPEKGKAAEDNPGQKAGQKPEMAGGPERGKPAGALSFGRIRIAGLNPGLARAMMAERHAIKAAAFKSALESLEAHPEAADIPPCGPGAGEVCIAVAKEASQPTGRTKPTESHLPRIGRKIAILIGNDHYQDPAIPELDSAGADAQGVAKVMAERLGYEVRVLKDATKADIARALNKLTSEVGANDSVTLYYAGHGYLSEKTNVGYWLPVDASASKPDHWISNNDIAKYLSNIPAKQVLLVSDSCFSGSLTREQKVRSGQTAKDPNDILDRRSVVVLSSGGEEPVSDEGKDGHSIFAWHLMQALGKVDKWSPGAGLYEQVRNEVTKEFPQEPQYGASFSAGHQLGGDYLLERRRYR